MKTKIQALINRILIIGLICILASGCKKKEESEPTPLPSPTLTTTDVLEVLMYTAKSGGSIGSDGGSTVTARGVCWSTKDKPTISDNKTNDGSGAGSFTSKLNNLLPNTKYYLRAYATNGNGTGYGPTLVFTTVSDKLTDIDGNEYPVIQIGNQVWMAENLKTTRLNNGMSISNLTDNTEWIYSLSPAYCWYNNDMATYKNTYGGLYNWYAVNSGRLCPEGWHVPTVNDWEALIFYLGDKTIAGNKLKETGTTHWYNNPNATNETGFTGLPGGERADNGAFVDVRYYGLFWSSSENENEYGKAYNYVLGYQSNGLDKYNNGKFFGFSVRCIKDINN